MHNLNDSLINAFLQKNYSTYNILFDKKKKEER